MSRYEFEEGTLEFPKTEFTKFKKEFLNEYSKTANKEIEKLNKEIEAFLLTMKGKRSVDWVESFKSYLNSKKFFEQEYLYIPSYWEVSNLLFEKEKETRPYASFKFVNKKPKLLKPFKIKLRQESFYFNHQGDCSITLDNAKATLTWSVPENNHAIDRGRNCPLGKLMFSLLNKVNWGSKGGVFWGNDEYNRTEARGPGEGATYVTASFGNTKKRGFY